MQLPNARPCLARIENLEDERVDRRCASGRVVRGNQTATAPMGNQVRRTPDSHWPFTAPNRQQLVERNRHRWFAIDIEGLMQTAQIADGALHAWVSRFAALQ